MYCDTVRDHSQKAQCQSWHQCFHSKVVVENTSRTTALHDNHHDHTTPAYGDNKFPRDHREGAATQGDSGSSQAIVRGNTGKKKYTPQPWV